MHLIALGLNHSTAPLVVRERLALNAELMVKIAQEIMHTRGINATVLVSTCNRTELYVEANSWTTIYRSLKCQDFDLINLKSYTYLYYDFDAVRHLMQVACGLDSMVLGEVEILGQLKVAYQLALEHGYVSRSLSRLFESTFAVAKKVRSNTQIGVNPVSVAYLAVRLAERIFSQLPNRVAMIIGAGETAQLLVKHLCGAQVRKFILANRTLLRTQAIAQEILAAGGIVELIELNQVPQYLARADIVVTTTAAPLPIVGKGMVEAAIKERKHRAMFMVDLSVPRNIEPQVQKIADVYLYGVDDLQIIAAEHKRTRAAAAIDAQRIIDVEAQRFMHWLEERHAVSTIQAFRKHCIVERDLALEAALRQIQNGKDVRHVLNRFAHNLVNRLIHEPTVQMRKASVAGDLQTLETVNKLFALEEEK